MIETITAWLINYGLTVAGGGIIAVIVGWIIKKIPFARFAQWAEKVGNSQGKAVTVFFNSWKYTKSFYEKLLEPIIIDTVNALFLSWIRGFVSGLKSDNAE